jgi:hypothetical protein
VRRNMEPIQDMQRLSCFRREDIQVGLPHVAAYKPQSFYDIKSLWRSYAGAIAEGTSFLFRLRVLKQSVESAGPHLSEKSFRKTCMSIAQLSINSLPC